ncbi:hypothetical protein ABGV42_00660 [Paenibacillus pabuli]|uniref:hypothetical protein n=1 Tax=Paenibacillus pabuli TaxID=1472 RepID=UPI0032425F17
MENNETGNELSDLDKTGTESEESSTSDENSDTDKSSKMERIYAAFDEGIDIKDIAEEFGLRVSTLRTYKTNWKNKREPKQLNHLGIPKIIPVKRDKGKSGIVETIDTGEPKKEPVINEVKEPVAGVSETPPVVEDKPVTEKRTEFPKHRDLSKNTIMLVDIYLNCGTILKECAIFDDKKNEPLSRFDDVIEKFNSKPYITYIKYRNRNLIGELPLSAVERYNIIKA